MTISNLELNAKSWFEFKLLRFGWDFVFSSWAIFWILVLNFQTVFFSKKSVLDKSYNASELLLDVKIKVIDPFFVLNNWFEFSFLLQSSPRWWIYFWKFYLWFLNNSYLVKFQKHNAWDIYFSIVRRFHKQFFRGVGFVHLEFVLVEVAMDHHRTWMHLL